MESTAVRNEVIVGIDPRERAGPALAWAADEALRRRSSLRLVVAVPPLPGGQHVDAPWNRSMLRMRGESALTDAVATVRALYAEVPLATELLDGTPAAVLCRRAARARMVVVGSRRLSRPEELLGAGSVAVPVSAGADCPVVVVGGPERAGRRHPRLVVGVDGSASSGAALAFAVEEAALHGAALHAVWVWRRPFVSFGDEAAGLDERRRALAETVAGRGAQHPDVKITQEVLRGHPVEELARASTDALVVVVGRHGRGGYSGMRLGSVVHGLLHRAECPVITVPESRHG